MRITPTKSEGDAISELEDFGLKVSIISTAKNILGRLSITTVSLIKQVTSPFIFSLRYSSYKSFFIFGAHLPRTVKKYPNVVTFS